MKKIFLFLCIISSTSIFSTDFKTYFTMNNFHFNDDNEILSSDYGVEYGEIVTQDINDGLYLDAGFTKSIISDYSVFTDFRVSNELFGFNIGIFTNFLNDSSKILTPGLNYGLDFMIPGIILVNLDLNNTIPNTSPLETGVNINNYSIRLGFYIGDAILSANLESENNSKGTILSSTATSINKYFLNMDLFNKYSKYRISIDMGWNNIARNITSLTTVDDTLEGAILEESEAGSAYIDSTFTLIINDYLDIDLGVLAHLIKLPLKNVDSFATDEFSWGLNCAFVLKL